MNEKTISVRCAFEGRLLTVDVIDVELDSGLRSTREVVRHPGAVAVLAQAPDDRFVMVRQFRKPVERELLEIIAGTLEPGEAPETCARREIEEETGYRADELHPLGAVALAPGYSSEILHLFFARLKDRPAQRSPDEDEKIDVEYLSRAELESLMDQGKIEDSKTLAAWCLYLRRFRG